MKIVIRLIIILLYIFNFNYQLFSQGKVLENGEELNYVVYYGFIRIGEVNMKLTKMNTENENIIYLANSTMRSYKGIPFVNLNILFESDLIYNGKEIYTKRFKAIDYRDDAVITIEYKFNYDSNYIYVRKDNNGRVERDDKIKFNENVKFQDGLSLFYRARMDSFSTENFLTPVFMNESETSVNYYFSSMKDEISISLFDFDINSVRCNGVANFEGVFGLGGEFAGWFSADEMRVPIRSQLNVVIGSITLELDSYKRLGWKPKK